MINISNQFLAHPRGNKDNRFVSCKKRAGSVGVSSFSTMVNSSMSGYALYVKILMYKE